MALAKNTFAGAEVADAAEVNENFAEIYTALASFPTVDTALRDDAVATANIAANAVTKVKLDSSMLDTVSLTGTDDTTLPTSLAAKTYIDAQVASKQEVFAATLTGNETGTNYATARGLTPTSGDNATDTSYWSYNVGANVGTYRFTVPVTGNYAIQLAVRGKAVPSGFAKAKIYNVTAAADVLEVNAGSDGATSTYNYVIGNGNSTTANLTATHKLELRTDVSGASAQVTGTDTQFAIIRLGATV